MSTLGDTLPVVAFVVIVGAVLACRRRWRDALVIVVGLTLELSVFLSTTGVVGRDRPPVLRVDSTPSTASFPSGHVAASLVLWGGTALIARAYSDARVVTLLAATMALTFPVAMAFARVYRGMHFVTDTVAGWLLGLAALAVAVATMRAVVLAECAQLDLSSPVSTVGPSDGARPPGSPGRWCGRW